MAAHSTVFIGNFLLVQDSKYVTAGCILCDHGLYAPTIDSLLLLSLKHYISLYCSNYIGHDLIALIVQVLV